jgi:hypothetical protein
MAAEIRRAFSQYAMGASCTPEDIAAAERQLGHALPPVVAELYREMDGFLGPTNAQFMYPLLQDRTNASRSSLVGMTLFLRSEDFPGFLGRAVAIGDAGTGPFWLVFLDEPDKVALWDAEWGDDLEWLEGGLLDVWLKEKALYDRLMNERASR